MQERDVKEWTETASVGCCSDPECRCPYIEHRTSSIYLESDGQWHSTHDKWCADCGSAL